MQAWEDIRKWRRATRAELVSRRLTVPRQDKPGLRAAITESILREAPELGAATIGFYWPFKGEVDLRGLVRDCLARGAAAALPVVVEKATPLEFWVWRPRQKLGRGIWNIPIPAERDVVHPTALLVPLIGFDSAGYRLGYGGGYYDRTLAAMPSRPLTIGIGYELGRLETIYPQPHDIPLDAIVTETGLSWFRYRGAPLEAAGRTRRVSGK
jgi:5-formyltetrahydrofolate cyclo-ligase